MTNGHIHIHDGDDEDHPAFWKKWRRKVKAQAYIERIEFARKCYFLHLLKRRGPKVCGTILGKCSWVAEVAKLFRQFLQWSRLTFFLSWGLTWHARWSLGFFSSRFLWLSEGVSCSSFRERGRASFRLIVGFHLMSAFDVAEQLRF